MSKVKVKLTKQFNPIDVIITITSKGELEVLHQLGWRSQADLAEFLNKSGTIKVNLEAVQSLLHPIYEAVISLE